MVDARETYAHELDAARIELKAGDRSGAAESFRLAIEAAGTEPDLQRELPPTLVQLGKLEQELGRPTEAERVLRYALALGERHFGADHPSLALALNELSRLYLRQSDYARAEAMLERLLGIMRAKGDEHPDVATALAGLAMAKRGLGDHAAAEQRFRDALRIRERVLAPNHMAIVVTMEQLSQTCADRGNLGEALALLQRALPTRVKAVGANHPTVLALRSQIAALVIQRAKSTLTSPAASSTPAPSRPAARASRPTDLVYIYEPEPAPRRNSAPRERVATPASSAAITAAAPEAPPAAAAAAVPKRNSAPVAVADMVIAVPPRKSLETARVVDVPVPLEEPVAHASAVTIEPARVHEVVVQSDVVQRDVVADAVARPKFEPMFSSSSPDFDDHLPRKRTALYLSAGLAVALALGALSTRTTGSSTRDGVATADVEQAGAAVATADGSSTQGARADSASTTSQSLALLAKAESRAPESAPSPALPSLPAAPKRLAKLNVPVITTNVDSLVRASTKVGRDADLIGISGGLRTSSVGDDVSGTPPVLIGTAPLPYFPDALRSQRTEGEVVVRFRVDERGRVDESSMKVVKSDHALFTLAVRSVLSRFRFEPARSPAPESKPRADWVDFRTEFTTKN